MLFTQCTKSYMIRIFLSRTSKIFNYLLTLHSTCCYQCVYVGSKVYTQLTSQLQETAVFNFIFWSSAGNTHLALMRHRLEKLVVQILLPALAQRCAFANLYCGFLKVKISVSRYHLKVLTGEEERVLPNN